MIIGEDVGPGLVPGPFPLDGELLWSCAAYLWQSYVLGLCEDDKAERKVESLSNQLDNRDRRISRLVGERDAALKRMKILEQGIHRHEQCSGVILPFCHPETMDEPEEE